MIGVADRRGVAPPITGRFAATGLALADRPKRLHRTRRRNARVPKGAVYVGRPTIWGNPFQGRAGISHARSVILYRAWLADELTPRILACAGFGGHEAGALYRWRERLLAQLDNIAGRNLQCWCPLTSAWCHADVLISFAAARAADKAKAPTSAGASTPIALPLPEAGDRPDTDLTGTGD